MACGPIFSFVLDGGRKQAHGLLNALELIDISNNIGDSRSLDDASLPRRRITALAKRHARRWALAKACCGSMSALKTRKI